MEILAGGGGKIRKIGGIIYLFVSRENKRIKPINVCVDVYV